MLILQQKLQQYKIDHNHNLNWTYDAQQATIGLEVLEAIQKSSDNNSWIALKS